MFSRKDAKTQRVCLQRDIDVCMEFKEILLCVSPPSAVKNILYE